MKYYLPYVCVILACFVDWKLALIIVGAYRLLVGGGVEIATIIKLQKDNKYMIWFTKESKTIIGEIGQLKKEILEIANLYSIREPYFEQFYYKEELLFSYDYSNKKLIRSYTGNDEQILPIFNNIDLGIKIHDFCVLADEKEKLLSRNFDHIQGTNKFQFLLHTISHNCFMYLGVIELNMFCIYRNFSFMESLLLLLCYLIPMNYEKDPQKIYKKA